MLGEGIFWIDLVDVVEVDSHYEGWLFFEFKLLVCLQDSLFQVPRALDLYILSSSWLSILVLSAFGQIPDLLQLVPRFARLAPSGHTPKSCAHSRRPY
jgi:hypothetical protein